MDSINLIATFYKQEIEQLREQLKQANERILDLEAEDKVEQVEAEIVK